MSILSSCNNNDFEKNLDKVCWLSICLNTNISVEFFEKHLDQIWFMFLCNNKSIPVEFFEKHLDEISWGNSRLAKS